MGKKIEFPVLTNSVNYLESKTLVDQIGHLNTSNSAAVRHSDKRPLNELTSELGVTTHQLTALCLVRAVAVLCIEGMFSDHKLVVLLSKSKAV